MVISLNLYIPLKNIVRVIDEESNPVEPKTGVDEITYILKSVKALSLRSKKLEDGMRRLEPIFQRYLLKIIDARCAG